MPTSATDRRPISRQERRLKQRMLQELVQENVDLVRGGPVRRLRRRRRLHFAGSLLALALLPVAVLASSRLLSVRAVPRPAPAAPAAPSRPVPTALAPAPASLAAPRPIDPSVFPLAVRRVVLDPGHGGDSTGTLAPSGVVEKEVTLDVARRLRRLLEREGFEVLLTRDRDRDVSLAERARIANAAGADVFVSIHVNWIENRTARGVETYYVGPTDDPFLTRLAAAENRESGYSMADFRKLLERVYADARQGSSRRLAQVLQGSLFRSLGRVNPEVEDRGVKTAPFIVLLSTDMPAVLAEVSCLSNREEAELLARPLYRQYIAEALAHGLRSYADAAERPQEKGI